MSRQVDQKEQEAKEFARHIADRLREARSSNSFGKLIFIAPPAFLGLLRKAVHPCCAPLVAATVNKNLVQHDLADIRGHLPEWF